ncbi:MAG: sigma-70 family RNA polymerase sigma factor [Myxococcales bacterium]|nr:sigma-70 family RNA polymerase sigma factor [Myxococcales bacterium]
MSTKTDEQLLLAWRAGDRKAGGVLFERHYPRVAMFFQNKVSEPDDLIQRTFLECVKAADRFRIDASFRAYLLGIAVNVLRNHYRRLNGPRNHAPLPDASVEDLGQTPSQVLAGREEERLLLAALRRLPVELQMVLELYYWERMKTHELAEVLGWPLGTVRDRLGRARRKLEELLAALSTSSAALESATMRLDEWVERLRERILAPDREDDE